jgi:hypothetical protein
MVWQKWIVLAYLVFQSLWLVAHVGRRREVITPTFAAYGLVEFAAIAWLVASI